MGLKAAVAAISAATLSVGAVQAWTIEKSVDRMTDKPTVTAWLKAKDKDKDTVVELLLGCFEDKLVGGHVVVLSFSRRLGVGRVSYRFRVDNRETETRFSAVGRDLSSLLATPRPDELKGGKRLRLEVFPTIGSPMFFDMDISGVDKALSSIPCKNERI